MAHRYHIAQINIARAKAPLDDPSMAGFVARLDEINRLADDSPGFVWRLRTDAGNATDLRAYDDDAILVNMSVWESPETLRDFVYRSMHAQVMRRRREWFERFEGMYYALWWVPAGHVPTVEEGKLRLAHLRQNGESPYAFSFARIYPPPGAAAASELDLSAPCPAF